MPKACDPAHLPTVRRARRLLSTYADMEELIRLGAYRAKATATGLAQRPDIAQAHTADEFVTLEQLQRYTDAVHRIIAAGA